MVPWRTIGLVASMALTAGCVAPTQVSDAGGDGGGSARSFHVDAVAGANLPGNGTSASPYKTITYALAAAGPGATIVVRPGTYDAALGEVFPLVLATGQTLVGDEANRGDGTAPTLITGRGINPAWGGGGYPATTVVAGDGSRILGFKIGGAEYQLGHVGVVVSGVTAQVSSNTLTAFAYSGLLLDGRGASIIENNVFESQSYGISAWGAVGGAIVRNNTFRAMPIPIDIEGPNPDSDVVIRGNSITGNGQSGIQVVRGIPLIENNTFNESSGYAYGAIRAQFSDARPKVRGNVFKCTRAVEISEGNPDLGTSGDPGNNDFSAVTGPSIAHRGTAAVSALGNTWPAARPVCGRDIFLASTGSVTWGTGAGERCPGGGGAWDGGIWDGGAWDGRVWDGGLFLGDGGPGSFIRVSPMSTARREPASVAFPSGEALVMGGCCDDGGLPESSVESFDSTTRQWTPRPSFPNPSFPVSAVLLAPGSVFLSKPEDAAIYRASSNSWTATPAMWAGQNYRTTVLLGLGSGRVLVSGGMDNKLGAATEIYEPTLNRWTAAAPMTASRYYHTATTLPSGAVLVAGGNPATAGCLSSAELYDPVADTWAPTASMQAARVYHTATLLQSGKVLVVGGSGGSASYPSAELYDPPSKTWSPTQPMSVGRAYHTATLLPSGRVLVAGGTDFQTGTVHASAEVYDPTSETWTLVPMMEPRSGHTAVLLPSGEVLLAGGTDLASAELYRP